MKKFKIEIEEVLQRVVEVEAATKNEAIDIAKNLYKNEEIILDGADFKGVEFSEYQDEVIKNRKYQSRDR